MEGELANTAEGARVRRRGRREMRTAERMAVDEAGDVAGEQFESEDEGGRGGELKPSA